MGAATFVTKVEAKNAKEAFKIAVEEAQYNFGHAGYTGTIAEKSEFTMISVPGGVAYHDHINTLINNDDKRIEDKWGPAGCIEIENGKYVFFGWASE